MRSTWPPSAIRSRASSTSAVTFGSSAAIDLAVNAFITSLRSRVWSGGSRSSMEMLSAPPPLICAACSAIGPSARLRYSTDRLARSSVVTSV
jgi:hypothetical protein